MKKKFFSFFLVKNQKVVDFKKKSETFSGQSPTVYTFKQVAALLYITPRTLYNWKDQGILPCTVIGSKTYLTEAQLQEFLKNHEVKPSNTGRVRNDR
jgi:hypothetical protein